jgi:uncharacterized protein YkwD
MRWTGYILGGVVLGAVLDGCLSAPSDDEDPASGDSDGGGSGNQDAGGLGDLSRVETGGGGQDSGGNDALWTNYGTRGSISGEPANGGHALCDLDDIRTDDLASARAVPIPDGSWGNQTVSDQPAFCGTEVETASWRLVNCERLSRDLAPLECDLRLVWVSRLHSQDMVARGYFDHTDPDGVDPFERMEARGIAFGWAGENIAAYPDPESSHFGWMESEGHRSNMLDTMFSHTGLGAQASGGAVYLTELFIGPP